MPGVAAGEMPTGWERRLNIEVAAGPAFAGMDEGSSLTCRRGLDVIVLDAGADVGAVVESSIGGCGWLSEPVSLYPLVSPSRSSSASSRMTPKTRRTTFPIASSLGCAEMSLPPTCCTISMSLETSPTRKLPTTRRSRWAVASAQSLDPRIWRLFRSLHALAGAWAFIRVRIIYEMRFSIDVSTEVSLFLTDLRNDSGPGAIAPARDDMLAVSLSV